MELGVKEISDGIFMITLPMPFRLEHVNVYAIVKRGRVSLIDTGPNFPGVLAALEQDLAGIGRKVSEVDRIFITHFHADHCGLAGAVQEASGAVVCMREMEYNRATVDPRSMIERLRAFYLREGMPDEVFEKFASLLKMFRYATIPFKAQRFLEPGTVEDLDGLTLEVISSPGHSAGQVVFFCRERGILFSGDHVLPHITPNLSPDLTNPGFHPLQSFIQSLEALKGLPVSMVYPAHGWPFPDLDGRIEEIVSHHEERKGLIEASVKAGPKTAYQVSQDIFGADISDFDKFLALNETYVHLDQLEMEKALRRKTQKGIDIYLEKKKGRKASGPRSDTFN